MLRLLLLGALLPNVLPFLHAYTTSRKLLSTQMAMSMSTRYQRLNRVSCVPHRNADQDYLGTAWGPDYSHLRVSADRVFPAGDSQGWGPLCALAGALACEVALLPDLQAGGRLGILSSSSLGYAVILWYD